MADLRTDTRVEGLHEVAGGAAVPAPSPSPSPQTRTGRLAGVDYKWLALAVVLVGSIMTILDSTIVNIAVQTLQNDFPGSTYNDVTWVVTGYMLAQGAVIPMAGWATDRWGTKRLYIGTMVLFTVSSALCGLAQNLPELIAFRVLQGLGGGMMMPIGMTIMLRVVGPRQMGRVMSIFGIPMLLAPAVGPVLGGWFVQDFTWRLIFYVNIPIGVVGVVAGLRILRETPRSHNLRLDLPGVLVGIPAVVALMLGIDRSTTLGWSSPLVIGLLVASAVLFAAFMWRELSTDEPLLQLQLFRDGTFSWAMVLSFIVVTGMFGGMLLLPLFLQQVHGWDPLETGAALLPQALTAAIFMPLGGALVDRFGPRWVIATGLVGLSAGSVLLAQLKPDSPYLLLVAALVLRGAAMAFSMMPTMAAALARVPREYTSRASSITNTLQRVGSSIGIAVLVTILVGQVATATTQARCAPTPAALQQAQQLAAASHQPVPQNTQELCAASAATLQSAITNPGGQGSSSAPSSHAGSSALGSFFGAYAGDSLSIAFDRTFAVLAIVTLIGVIPAMFLKRPEKQDDDAPQHALVEG